MYICIYVEGGGGGCCSAAAFSVDPEHRYPNKSEAFVTPFTLDTEIRGPEPQTQNADSEDNALRVCSVCLFNKGRARPAALGSDGATLMCWGPKGAVRALNPKRKTQTARTTPPTAPRCTR